MCFMSCCNFPMANESPNCLILVPDGDGHIIVASSSTCTFNTTIHKSSQQLAALFQQAKFWTPWDWKFAPRAFFKPNNDELVSFETKQILCYILCHLIPLDVHVLGLKTQGRK